MAVNLDKLTSLVSDLRTGETFSVATRCVPKGMIARQAAFGAFGALGALAAQKGATKQDVAGAPLPKALVLALTNERLFIFKVSQMSGRTTDVHATIELGQIAKFDCGKAHMVGLKQLNMTIEAVDGRAITVEVPRAFFSAGERFAEALTAAAPGAAAAALAEPTAPIPAGLTEVAPAPPPPPPPFVPPPPSPLS